MKLSFKKHPRSSGLARIGEADFIDIKGDKKIVGNIVGNGVGNDNRFRVGLIVKDLSSNLKSWKWVFFKARFDTEAAARLWVEDKWDVLQAKYEIHQLED